MDVDVLASIIFLTREFTDPVTGRPLTRSDCQRIDMLHTKEFRLVDLWDRNSAPPSTIIQTAKNLNKARSQQG